MIGIYKSLIMIFLARCTWLWIPSWRPQPNCGRLPLLGVTHPDSSRSSRTAGNNSVSSPAPNRVPAAEPPLAPPRTGRPPRDSGPPKQTRRPDLPQSAPSRTRVSVILQTSSALTPGDLDRTTVGTADGQSLTASTRPDGTTAWTGVLRRPKPRLLAPFRLGSPSRNSTREAGS
jgi:hypothetical protein